MITLQMRKRRAFVWVDCFLACALKLDTVQMLMHRHAVLVLAGVVVAVAADARSHTHRIIIMAAVVVHRIAHRHARNRV
jgi:hypothetical protein